VLLAALASLKAVANLFGGPLLLGMFWALETAVTILHCRHYVCDFIRKSAILRAGLNVPSVKPEAVLTRNVTARDVYAKHRS
jgi:hypothetical protein